MVVESADHGNDVVLLLFCSFFLSSEDDFPRKFNENGRKNKYATFSRGLFNK